MVIKVKELYNLLDDCHSAFAKSTMNEDLYHRMSKRLIEMKRSLQRNSMVGKQECPACDSDNKEDILVYSKSCNKCSNEWID